MPSIKTDTPVAVRDGEQLDLAQLNAYFQQHLIWRDY